MDSVSQLLHHLEEVRRARNENCVRLLDEVEDIRRRRQRACVRLLRELTPHLHAARAVERELDRHLARRFNVFRYLRDDELGLSRIIADLLDPDGEHGQGATYQKAMLELLEVPPAASDSSRIRVVTERGFGGRFIDITVDIPTDDGPFCLAFENKPYAGDQHRQCIDYLESLDGEYDGRFLLVYLPPRYRMPDESSLRLEDYRRHWTKYFRVLPYVADDAPHGDDGPADEDGGASVRADSGADDAPAEDTATDHETAAAHADAVVGDGASLADWFGTCWKLSEAERLRWFLREAQLYCREHFGDSTMTDTEARYIREYLDQNPRHLDAAFAVARAWPAVEHDVCRRFLEHLRDRVEERVRNEFPAMAGDLHIGCHYGGGKKESSNYLRVYRYGWVRYEGVSDLRSDGRTAVMLQCGRGPTSWYWGVRMPKNRDDMTEPEEKKRREDVEGALKGRGLSLPHVWDTWLQAGYTRYQDWTAIVPELAQELADSGGKITDYYVNGLLGIARRAIPAIDEVELENKSASALDDS